MELGITAYPGEPCCGGTDLAFFRTDWVSPTTMKEAWERQGNAPDGL